MLLQNAQVEKIGLRVCFFDGTRNVMSFFKIKK